MPQLKKEAISTINKLPDDAEMEDIIEALCIRLTIEDRLRELDAGQYIEHKEVEKRLLRG